MNKTKGYFPQDGLSYYLPELEKVPAITLESHKMSPISKTYTIDTQ